MMVHFTFLRGVEVDAETRGYVEKKVQAAGKALTEGLVEANVEIGQDKRERFSVEVMIRSGKDVFRAKEDRAESTEEAIDKVEEKLQVQIRENRKRVADLEERGGRSVKKRLTVDEGARF